jgi:hypothetical protein
MLAMAANDNALGLITALHRSFSRAGSLLQESIPMFNGRLPSLALPCGAARAHLRGGWTSSHLHFKRLRANVSAKQNGFWQIVH